MRTSQCAVYQVKETPEYRDVRFRSYEKLRSEGKRVSIENYQQVYIGRIQPGETPADIKMRLQKQRPKNFKGHSIGCSDVLVITDEGKTTAYYINKDGFIIIPEFLTIKSSADTRLSIDTTGYEIEGKKGTWLAQDYILMNEKKWFLAHSDADKLLWDKMSQSRVWGGSPTSVFAARRDAKIASVATLALLAVSAYPGKPTEKRRQRRFLRSLRFSGFLYSLCGGFHDRQFILVHCV